MNSGEKFVKTVLVLGVLWVVFLMSLIGGIGYVAFHFISKYW